MDVRRNFAGFVCSISPHRGLASTSRGPEVLSRTSTNHPKPRQTNIPKSNDPRLAPLETLAPGTPPPNTNNGLLQDVDGPQDLWHGGSLTLPHRFCGLGGAPGLATLVSEQWLACRPRRFTTLVSDLVYSVLHCRESQLWPLRAWI